MSNKIFKRPNDIGSFSDNETQAQLEIVKRLGDSHLAWKAAEALTSMINKGYCEFTEDKELWSIAEPYVCEYCAKWHDLKDCCAYLVGEYRALGDTKEERRRKQRELYPA